MRVMKDSGIEWIGEIPQDWEVKKGKYIFCLRNNKGNNFNLELLSPSQKFGVIPQKLLEKLTGQNVVKLNEDVNLSFLKTVHYGDFCISLRSFQGGFEYSKYEGVVSPAYQIFYTEKELCNEYYKYLFKTQAFISKINSYTISLRDGKPISYTDFGNTLIPIPPVPTQQAIADYLDRQCGVIDGLVEDINREIEKLQEYKKSVITEAVTGKQWVMRNSQCGIEEKRKMKDSGIEWIGEIPQAWEVKRVKYVIEKVDGGIWGGDPVIDGENYLVLRSTEQTIDGKWNIIEPALRNLRGIGNLSCFKVRKEDLLITKSSGSKSHIGKTSLVSDEMEKSGYFYSNFMARIHSNKKIKSKFLWYLLNISLCREQFVYLQNSTSGIGNINADNIEGLLIPIPNTDEQEKITDYLDQKCEEIDALVAEKEKQVEKLQEYKKALIFECVTGKREVA